MQKEVIWDYSFLLYKLKVIYFSVFAASCLQVYNPFSQQMYAYDNKKMVQCYFGNRNIAYGSKFCLSLENGRIFVTRKTKGIYCRFWYGRWAGVCFYSDSSSGNPYYFWRNQLLGRYYLFGVEMGFVYNYALALS